MYLLWRKKCGPTSDDKTSARLKYNGTLIKKNCATAIGVNSNHVQG